MRVIIFDLDFTLASTENCQPYLTTVRGRGEITDALHNQSVNVSFYDARLANDFNSLQEVDNCCVVVVSDSPKDYCLQVLALGGYKIDSRLVFGAQSKPLVNVEALLESLEEVLDVDAGDFEFLVIGDSPKDIYFAHSIRSPSVFASWGTRHKLSMVEYSRPSCTAAGVEQLREHIMAFLRGDLNFEDYNFSGDYITLDVDELCRVELSEAEIGYGHEYVPDHNHYRNDQDKWSSRDLRWIVKKAKNFTRQHHDYMRPMPMYGRDGPYETTPLKSKAGHFKRDFLKWCVENRISGKILLVPVPSSVPRECNLSFTIGIICDWWATWINKECEDMDVEVLDAFERFWPRQPSHQSEGRRTMDEHFDTLGMFSDKAQKKDNIDYVIIVDDVVTSGAHMNAIASFIKTLDVVEEETPILGYALFKTAHPEQENAESDNGSFIFRLNR